MAAHAKPPAPNLIQILTQWTVAVPIVGVLVLAVIWGRELPGVMVVVVTVGATRISHLDDAISAVELELRELEIERLSASYSPRAVAGH